MPEHSSPPVSDVARLSERRLIAFNRGIATAVSYSAVLFLWMALTGPVGATAGWPSPISAAIIGAAAGCIVAFSRAQDGAPSRERLLLDATSTVGWMLVLVSVFALLRHYGSAPDGAAGAAGAASPKIVAIWLLWYAIGAGVGSVRGPDALRWIADRPIQGRRPFAAVTRWTADIAKPDVQFVVRVIAHSATLVVLGVLAYIAAMIVLAVLVIFAALYLLTARSGEASSEPDRSSSTSRASSTPRRSRSPSFFATECARCGSREHATDDCPQGFFSTACARCESREHATEDCPHGIFSTACARCGSTSHATDDCPHGIFSIACARCGNREHATEDCPHGFFSTACARCGSTTHATEQCPH